MVVWPFFDIAFLSVGMKTELFQSCGHCWVSQICWHIWCNTFTASSFRIWNSSTGIPSLPLALFIVMLPKAHLTSDSRISGSRGVITLSWLSRSWRSLLYSSVYSFHLFLIFSALIRSFYFHFPLSPTKSSGLIQITAFLIKSGIIFFGTAKSRSSDSVPPGIKYELLRGFMTQEFKSLLCTRTTQKKNCLELLFYPRLVFHCFSPSWSGLSKLHSTH